MTTTTTGQSEADTNHDRRNFWVGLVVLLAGIAVVIYSYWTVIDAIGEPWVGTKPFIVGLLLPFAFGYLFDKGILAALVAAVAYVALVPDDFADAAFLGSASFVVAATIGAVLAVAVLRLVRRGLVKRDSDGDLAAGDDDEPENSEDPYGVGDRIIVGLSGYAGAGKDTAAEVLIDAGFTRVSFADKLREFALAVNPLVPVTIPGLGETEDQTTHLRLDDYLATCGGDWTIAKKNFEVRRLLQTIGTEAGRNTIGENVWVDAVMSQLPPGNIVVTDMRFSNEYDAIVTCPRGLAVRINRPGTEPVNPHVSETALDDHLFHGVIENAGSVSRLQAALASFVSAYDYDED